MQLWLSSQPQPLWVCSHSGYSVPYQLHCCPAGSEDEELDDELLELSLLELDSLLEELEDELLDEELEDELDELPPSA